MQTPEMATKANVAVKNNLRRLPGWWFSVAVCLALVGIVADQQLEILLYKVLLVNLGVLIGYMLDRTMMKNAQNLSETQGDLYGGCRLIARAVLVFACILGMTVGI